MAPKPPPQMPQQLATLMAQFAQEAQSHAPSPSAPRRAAPAPQPAATTTPVPSVPVVASHRHATAPPPPSRTRGALFGDRTDLVRGIIAAEVLGKPLALRDE